MNFFLFLLNVAFPRLVLLIVMLPGFLFAADKGQRYEVFLQNPQHEIALKIATLVIENKGDKSVYQLSMHEPQFGDYFLSMRPFKCMTDKVKMLCHLAYPYAIERQFSKNDLSALEHDFLFIRRKPTDYGIDPWKGLYYRIQQKGDMFIGQAHEVDLNILAVPPEDEVLGLINAELHEIDGEQLWLPKLLIKPE